MDPAELPRVRLASLPTPVDELPRLSEATGRRILLKRDDLTGLALGGNKTRKLELLAADALHLGADTLVTTGAPQSNHCRQTAAAAARLGMHCTLVLSGESRPAESGNLLLDNLLGADLVWSAGLPREAALEAANEQIRVQGRRPYVIPYGGSNPLGAAAYILAMRELESQGVDPDWLVFASSSGGTQAGIALGLRTGRLHSRALGISVDLAAGTLRSNVADLANRTAAELSLETTLTAEDILVEDGYLGGGYGVMGDSERAAIHLFARAEGVLLDPVYTGRAAAGLLGLIRLGTIARGETVLFWHTGGTPALWSYAKELV